MGARTAPTTTTGAASTLASVEDRDSPGPPATERARDALLLGWMVAEVRGLCNPVGPRPETTPLPTTPPDVLPLRSQRDPRATLRVCASIAESMVERLGLPDPDAVSAGLSDALTHPHAWARHRAFFFTTDARIQDELARTDEQAANAYLLGRGMAECYWGLGPSGAWEGDSGASGCAPRFLLGEDRRLELSRMLGRLRPGHVHPLTPAVVSGTMQAWGYVVEDGGWEDEGDMRSSLYEQLRRWYQLLVLQQDPTTLVRPYARIGNTQAFRRSLKVLWPQLLAGAFAVTLVSGLVASIGDEPPGWLQPLLATGSAGALVVGGLLGRARGAAQLWATRLRQDVYTDLVAVDMTSVPRLTKGRAGARRQSAAVEKAVRQRLLTPSTTAPAG